MLFERKIFIMFTFLLVVIYFALRYYRAEYGVKDFWYFIDDDETLDGPEPLSGGIAIIFCINVVYCLCSEYFNSRGGMANAAQWNTFAIIAIVAVTYAVKLLRVCITRHGRCHFIDFHLPHLRDWWNEYRDKCMATYQIKPRQAQVLAILNTAHWVVIGILFLNMLQVTPWFNYVK